MYWDDVARDFRWEPFLEMRRLQNEMKRLLGGSVNGPEPARSYPLVNVWSGKDDVVVAAELPGMDPNAIDISVLGNTLTLKGARRAEEIGDETAVHRQERGFGEFVRTIELPVKVDPARVQARYERGVLYITLPRAEEDKPRQVKVKVA